MTTRDELMSNFAVCALRRAIPIGAALVLVSCSGVVDAERTPVASVTLSQNAVSVEVGAMQQLTATVRDAEGNTLSGRQVFWSSSDTLVVRVSATGLISGIAPGNAQIAASVERQSDVAAVVVVAPPVDRVAVSPPNPTLPVRQALQLTATLTDARGGLLGGRPVSWESSNPEIATVDAAGVVTGVSPGSAAVTATAEGVRGTTAVSIMPGPPARLVIHFGNDQTGATGAALPDSLAVRVTDADGFAVPGVTVAWSAPAGSGSVQPASSLTGADGVARSEWTLGTSPGNHTAVAALEGVASVTFSARARPGRVGTVTVTPASTALTALASTASFTAAAFDALGNALPGETFTWSSSDPAVAAITSGGVATALRNGTTTISARAEGVTGTATLVVAQSVARVLVNPTSATLALNDTLRLAAAVTDANGYPVPGAINWTTSNSTIATVNSSGLVRGIAIGSVTITATSGGMSGSSSISVQSASVDSVSVIPSFAAVRTGESVQFQAITYDASGGELTGRQVSWASSNPTIATVNNNGRVTGVRPGNVTITATSEGRSGTASARVDPGAPTTLSVYAGDQQVGVVGAPLPDSLAVRVTDAQGNAVPGVTVIWAPAAGSGSIAPLSTTTNSNGIARARWTLGTQSGDHSATATVTGLSPATFTARARPGNVTRVTVTPGSATLPALASSATYTAAAYDAYGNLVPGQSFTWRSSAPQVASVSSSGVATAVANGQSTITARTAQVDGDAAALVAQQVETVSVAPSSSTLAVGETVRLVASARDANGYPVAGASFSWTSSAPAVASVNSSGLVRAEAVGSATITAAASGRSGSASVNVGASTPAAVTAVAGSGQTGTVGQPLAALLVARVTDAAGNPVAGVTVSWSASGDGTLDPPSSVTDADGRASSRWTLGTSAGAQTAQASVQSLAPAAFTATARPGAPAALLMVSGDGQSARAGQQLAAPLVVRVTDSFGNPVAGVPITWTPQQNGSAAPPIAETDSQGHASSLWTLGTGPPEQYLEAATAGLPSVVFTAQRLTGQDET